MVVIVTVELLSQLVDIGPDERGCEILACGFYRGRILRQRLHQIDLLGQVVRGGNAPEVDTRFGSLAQNRADTRVGVLDERSRVAVEVDRLAGVKQHRLLGVYLEDEVFEGAQSDHRRDSVRLLLGTSVEFAQLGRHLAGRRDHAFDQIVGIDHRALARFHLALRKLHHAVGQVGDMVAPVGIAQLLEHQLQYLKMVILFVTHDVDHRVEALLLETGESGAEVLGHVDRRAVAPQQQFLVEAVFGQVDPDRVVLLAEEDALSEPLFDERLAQQVGLRFVVYLVEVDPHRFVGLVETLVYPAVHRLPQLVDFRVFGFPLAQHLLGLLHDRGLFFRVVLAYAFGG